MSDLSKNLVLVLVPDFHLSQNFVIKRSWCNCSLSFLQLVKLFPKESGAHKQERQIPFFPSGKRT